MHQAEFNLSLASSHSNHMSSAGICIRMLDLSKHSWVCVCDFVAVHRRILSCLLVAALPVCLYSSADLVTQRLQCSLKQAEGHKHMWTRSVWHECVGVQEVGWTCLCVVRWFSIKMWTFEAMDVTFSAMRMPLCIVLVILLIRYLSVYFTSVLVLLYMLCLVQVV